MTVTKVTEEVDEEVFVDLAWFVDGEPEMLIVEGLPLRAITSSAPRVTHNQPPLLPSGKINSDLKQRG